MRAPHSNAANANSTPCARKRRSCRCVCATPHELKYEASFCGLVLALVGVYERLVILVHLYFIF